MSKRTGTDRIFTIPNLVSFIRLAVIPVFWWLVLGVGDIAAATILYLIVATTDWIDGYLARRLNQVTRLGKALDPVADRLMIVSAVVAGLIGGIVPPLIGVTLMVREGYMAVVTLVLVARGAGTLEVRWLGKTATFLVYAAIGWFYLAHIPLLEWLFIPLAWSAGVVGLVLYWTTAVQYTGDALRTVSGVRVDDEYEER